MKILIASDIHGSAYYCRELLKALDREKERSSYGDDLVEYAQKVIGKQS